MTQALAGFNQHGIILATDSLATRFDAQGRPEFFNVEKLFPLSRHCAILSGGAGVSVPLSLALRQEIAKHRGLDDLEEIADFALMFLSRAYARHLTHHELCPRSDFGPLLQRLADKRELDADSLRVAPAPVLARLHDWVAAGWLHRATTRGNSDG